MLKHINTLKKSLTPLYSPSEVKAIISLLLEEVCGLSRVDVIIHPEIVLPAEQGAILDGFADKLATGMPVQQVLGYEYFMGKKFDVTPDVLIPRPETAELVNWIVEDNQGHFTDNDNKDIVCGSKQSINILDIGTGSGCIAISLASLINNPKVSAIDLSTGALKIAEQNAKKLEISNVKFYQLDILENKNKSFQQAVDNVVDKNGHVQQSTAVDKFDVIVSNPPYITEKEKAEMSDNVLNHEPHLALFVPDDDPLLFYRAIAEFGLINLKAGGKVYFEINSAFGNETKTLLTKLGYSNVELRQDADGRDRMIKASL